MNFRSKTLSVIKKILQYRHTPILLLLLVSFSIGCVFLKDYGISVDEPGLQEYARQSLASYAHWIDSSQPIQVGPGGLSADDPTFFHRYYGPAFLMVSELGYRVVKNMGLHPDVYITYHFFYYLLFLLGVYFLYLLCDRWFSTRVSFLAGALFLTQPLLLGHAFINPKDTPFMSLFIISVYLGLRAVDRLPAGDLRQDLRQLASTVARDFNLARPRTRRTFFILLLVLFILGIALPVFSGALQGLLGNVVGYFYTADTGSWAGRVFARVAAGAASNPLVNYVNIAWRLLLKLVLVVIGTWLAALMVFLAKISPVLFSWLAPKKILAFLKMTGKALISPSIIIAGVLIGFTTSVRVMGLYILVIVGIIAWLRNPHRAFPFIVAAFSYMCLATYITWPFLWQAPWKGFVESFTVMSQFPWPGTVFFSGANYSPSGLPAMYLPTLLVIQFTIPVIAFISLGFIFCVLQLFKKNLNREMAVLFCLWFLVPIFYFIFAQTTLYHNFRQLLFTIPPIFLLAGFGIYKLLEKIKFKHVYLILMILSLAPGIYYIYHLHPYEYIYYNAFAGGVKGASLYFETDYWDIAFREMANKVNQIVPDKATIAAWGAPDAIKPFLRKDILLISNVDYYFTLTESFDYAIIDSRSERTQPPPYQYAPILFSIERDGVTLAELKYVKGLKP